MCSFISENVGVSEISRNDKIMIMNWKRRGGEERPNFNFEPFPNGGGKGAEKEGMLNIFKDMQVIQ